MRKFGVIDHRRRGLEAHRVFERSSKTEICLLSGSSEFDSIIPRALALAVLCVGNNVVHLTGP